MADQDGEPNYLIGYWIKRTRAVQLRYVVYCLTKSFPRYDEGRPVTLLEKLTIMIR